MDTEAQNSSTGADVQAVSLPPREAVPPHPQVINTPSAYPHPVQPMYYYAPQQQAPQGLPPGAVIMIPPSAVQVGQPYGAAPYASFAPYAPPQQNAPVYSYANGLMIAAVITYFVSYWLFITQIASIAISLHMVRKGYIVKHKATVFTLSMLELIGWIFVPAFAWYTEEVCSYTYDSAYYTYTYTYCVYYWLGWIAFIIWGVFTLAFGIPRIVFTWRYDQEPKSAPASVAMGVLPTYSQR